MDRKQLLIIQPGRNGDILLVLPIAKYYYDMGYEITWPICTEYINLFDYVNFPMDTIDIGSILNGGRVVYNSSIKAVNDQNFDTILNLAIGFGDTLLDFEWKSSILPFDQWKYKKANVPYFNKYNLSNIIVRDFKYEEQLINEFFNKDFEEHKTLYTVIHQNGSNNRHFGFKITDKNIVEIIPKKYTIFDWLGLLSYAYKIYCVDSCFLNLVDQFKIIPPGGRFVHFWSEYYSIRELYQLSPLISSDWQRV